MGYNPNITTIYKQVFIHLQKKPLILTSCNIQVVQVVQFSHRFPRPRGLPGLSFSFATLGTLCTFSACFAVTTHVNDRWEGPGVCGKEDKGSVLIGSMYGIVTCIWLKFMMNVGKTWQTYYDVWSSHFRALFHPLYVCIKLVCLLFHPRLPKTIPKEYPTTDQKRVGHHLSYRWRSSPANLRGVSTQWNGWILSCRNAGCYNISQPSRADQ